MDTSEESSSEYSTDSSDEDGMEIAQINNVKLQLPQGLCERQDIFREFFTVDLWNSLTIKQKQHLQTFLPDFPENDDYEKSITLQRLFDCSIFKFNSPLLKFHDDLRAGYYRPDIARMRKIIRKAEQKEAKYRYKTLKEQLKHDVIESQRKLLNQIKNLPPGIEPKQEKRKLNVDYVTHRTKKRYFHVLQTIRTKVDDPNISSDENYPEGPPVSLSRKQKRHLNSIRNGLVSSKERFFHTTMTPNTVSTFDLEKYVMPSHNPFYINDEAYRNLIYQHRKRKLENPDDQELNTKGITLSDIVNRTQLPYIKNINIPSKLYVEQKIVHRKKIKKEHNKSQESINNKHYGPSSNSDTDSDSLNDNVTVPRLKVKPNKPLPILTTQSQPPPSVPPPLPPPAPVKTEIKKEPMEMSTLVNDVNNVPPIKPINNFSQYGKIMPVKVEDLEGIDMMNIPIDLDNSDIDILELSNKPELMQETHANFFSLIRDVICSTNEHRMNMYMLQERLKAWQENPISPLNDWYSLTDNWIGLLPSAITFLCGNSSEQPDDFVPYMEYKTAMDVYQWIGAGRDSDTLLSTLCTFWLDHRTENKQHVETVKEKEEIDVEISDRSQTPPPPRCPTNWTVRKATPEEVKEFREQERRRYDNPHKAFTYRCNGYESVVGPLKGIYNPAVGNAKARGHTMLNADRPNFVTILSLVRDATARLPNGEGTRAEICELLKSSQYISSTAPDNVLQSVVSGALDRMHTQFDPCVKYDPKRKIWIYLHRNRTEEDFERIHQQYQGMQKSKKTAAKKSPTKPKNKVKPVKTESHQTQNDAARTNARRPSPMKSVIPSPTLVPVSQTNSTSLLIANNANKMEESVQQTQKLSNTNLKSTEEKEINQAIQAIVQNRVSSPTIKSNKSLVKILSPSQGKSLIIPTSNQQILKQIQEQRNSNNKQMNVTQQLLQTIAVQQKQIIVQKQIGGSDNERTAATGVEQNIKVPVSIQQQIIQSITPQQLQNIKNVTLLRTQNQNVNFASIASASQSNNDNNQNNIVTVAVSKQATNSSTQEQIIQPSVQIKTHGTLTHVQQQQILQTLKQKILPQTNLLQSQQIILKQKNIPQIQKQIVSSGTSLLNQTKVASESSTVKVAATNSQGPVVAKVLTNAAGQVISVESLLAHQKQHGSLPQGTTLRVSGTKAGQNIIHLTGSTKPNQLAQFTMASQNNLITLSSQPKLVVASQTTSVTSTVTTPKPTSRTISKPQPQTITKFTPKVTQQLINAKLLQENQKIVQPKLVMSQSAAQTKLGTNKNLPINKPLTLNVAGGNANTIRMVNTANLNLTHIGGKPVLLASKGGAIQNIQGQNVILQPNSGGPSLVLQHKNATTNLQQQTSSSTNNLLINQQNIVFAPQMKVQQQPQVVFNSNIKNVASSVNQQQNITQSHLMLGSHPVRLQTSTASSSTQRVVLASQGQGGQIVAQQLLLPASFQGTAINIKALQGLKVIPIAQATGQNKGVQGRQVFARVMSPTVVKTTQANPLITEKTTDSVPSTE